MKTLVVGMGAFGFAIAHHISRNHPNHELYAYERDTTITDALAKRRIHPYFFSGIALSQNVVLVDDIREITLDMDVIIVAIPIPFYTTFVESIATHLKSGVLFVNCSKGIDNTTLATVSDIFKNSVQNISYTYSVLSGGMIAQELVSGSPLAATIGISDMEKSGLLRDLLESPVLEIAFSTDYKNIELYGALKNIFALSVGYQEGRGYGMSTVAASIIKLYQELPSLLVLLGGTDHMSFSDAALGGDLIATCFGNSRNRYFGSLVGKGTSPEDAVIQLRTEKKHAEGYETLRGIVPIIQDNHLPSFQEVVSIFFPDV